MSDALQPFAELDRLLDCLAAGTLDEPGHARLDELVLSDLAARRHYIERMYLMAELHARLARTATPAEVPVPRVESAPLDRRRGLRRFVPAVVRRRPLAWSIAGCGMLFAAYIAVVSWGMLDKQSRGLRLEAREGQQLAYISESESALWQKQPQAGLPAASEAARPSIARDEPLELVSGAVEIKLRQGVTLVVEGPARWTIDGDNRVTLNRGRLLASVPRDAIGFTVATPTATVVDLGTEFGVTVDERGGTRTRVFKGEVRLHTASRASTPATPQGTASRRLTAGQAVAIDAAGNITAVEPEFVSAEQFIRRAGEMPPETDPPGAYSRAVLALEGLVGYWRLAEAEPGYARDEVRTTRPITAAPAGMGRSPGDYREFWMADFRQPGVLVGEKNCGVHFNGESYVEVADHPSLSGDWDGLTLAAWIKPEAQQPPSAGSLATIIGKWAFEVTGDEYCLAYRRDGRLLIAVGNGDRASNGEQGMYGAGNIRIAPDQFSFVVGTWEQATGRYRLYVNGQPDQAEGTQAAPHKLNGRSYAPVMIGGQRVNNDRYFAGTIDEVCILDRELTPEEVKHLYKLSGQPEEKANEDKGN